MPCALFFKTEDDAFRPAAEWAVALNPMDCFTMGHMGLLLAYGGEWQRGCALTERAMELNPRSPGWFWFPAFYNAYRQGAHRAALDAAIKVNMPGYFFNHVALAAAHGQLGHREAAGAALGELVGLKPAFAGAARAEFAKWFGPELVEHLVDGLRQAVLGVPRRCVNPTKFLLTRLSDLVLFAEVDVDRERRVRPQSILKKRKSCPAVRAL